MVLMFIDLYLLATIGPAFCHRIATEGISKIEFREQVSLNGQRDITPTSGESEGIAIVGIVVGFCVPFSVILLGHRDISLAT